MSNKAFYLFLKKEEVRISGVFLLALVIRFLLLPYNRVINVDSCFYLGLAESIKTGTWGTAFHPYWSPLYPFLTAIVLFFTDNLEWAGKAVPALAGSAVVFPLYVLSKKMFGTLKAMISVLLLAVYPLHIKYSCSPLTEIVYGFFLLWMLLILWDLIEHHGPPGPIRKKLAGIGVLLGLAYLTRPEAFVYIGFITLWLTYLAFTRRVARKEALIGWLVFLLTLMAIMLPYLLFIKARTGVFSISAKGGNFMGVHGQEGELSHSLFFLVRYFFTSIKAIMVYLVSQISFNFTTRVVDLASPVILVLITLGIWSSRWGTAFAKKQFFLLGFFLYSMFFYSLLFCRERHMTIFVPLVTIWVALGACKIKEWWSSEICPWLPHKGFWQRPGFIPALLALLFLVLFVKPITYPLRKPLYEEPYEYKEAGLFIKEDWVTRKQPGKPRIMSAYPWPAFYAEGQYIGVPGAFLPGSNQDQRPASLDEARVHYVVVTNRLFRQDTPAVRKFIQGFPPPGNADNIKLLGTRGTVKAQARIYYIGADRI